MSMIAHKCPDIRIDVVDINEKRIGNWFFIFNLTYYTGKGKMVIGLYPLDNILHDELKGK